MIPPSFPGLNAEYRNRLYLSFIVDVHENKSAGVETARVSGYEPFLKKTPLMFLKIVFSKSTISFNLCLMRDFYLKIRDVRVASLYLLPVKMQSLH